MYELRIFTQKGANNPEVYQNENLDILLTKVLFEKYYTITKLDRINNKVTAELIKCK